MTVGDWFLITVGVGVTAFGLVAVHAAWRDRRRPVRDSRGQWRMPRPYGRGVRRS
jgi:hypothetical protein